MNISELKGLWDKNVFRPAKRLGQNFLVDNNIKDKIFSLMKEDTSGGLIVEIGPGFGAMSFELSKRCKELILVEKDKKICGIMRPVFEALSNVRLIEADVMSLKLGELSPDGRKILVYGNIPYNISTPLVEKMIEERGAISHVYFVMQEEVVDRLVARPGGKEYGSLSCFAQFYTKAVKMARIKRNSFYPKPQVDSALIKFTVLEEPSVNVPDEALFFRVVRAAFSQRRKKAVNPLSDVFSAQLTRNEWSDIFGEYGISEMKRAEDLSLDDFARITHGVYGMTRR